MENPNSPQNLAFIARRNNNAIAGGAVVFSLLPVFASAAFLLVKIPPFPFSASKAVAYLSWAIFLGAVETAGVAAIGFAANRSNQVIDRLENLALTNQSTQSQQFTPPGA